MTSLQDLKKTRKFLMSFSILSLLLLLVMAASNWSTSKKAREFQVQITEAHNTLQQANQQLETFRLGETQNSEILHLKNLKDLSIAVNRRSMSEARQLLKDLEPQIQTLMQLSDQWVQSNLQLQKMHSNLEQIISRTRNKVAATDVSITADAMMQFLQAPPSDAEARTQEIIFLRNMITTTDSLFTSSSLKPLQRGWEAFTESLETNLAIEKKFFDTRLLATQRLTGYGMQIRKQMQQHLKRTESVSLGFLIATIILCLIILWALKSLQGNPRLNTMMASTNLQSIQAEMEMLEEQMDNLLADVDEAWLDSRQEMSHVKEALKESKTISSELRTLRSQINELADHIAQQLNDSPEEQKHFYTEIEKKSQELVSLVDSLEENGDAVLKDLEKIFEHIRKLAKETQRIKGESEQLEESAQVMHSAVD